MPKYTFQAGAHWPNSLIDLTNYKDADNTVGQYIAQIKAYQEAGNFDAAQQIITAHADVLKQYAYDASDINKYIEELRNLEIYTKSRKQQIYYEPTEEEVATYGELRDVWLGNAGRTEGVVNYGNVTDKQVLEGYTYTYRDGTLHSGSMTDYGAVSVDLLPGESYTIPAGYHNGGGVVNATASGSSTGGTKNLGTYDTNGLYDKIDVTGAKEVFFRVQVPTIQQGEIQLKDGTVELILDKPVTQFAYITGYKLQGKVGYSIWTKLIDGSWEKKNSDGGDGLGIKSISNNIITIKWKNTVTFKYYAF